MPRQKSDDPKVSVSIRIRESVLKRYQEGGDDWRDRMHQALIDHLNGPPREAPEVKAARSRIMENMRREEERSATAKSGPKVDIQVGPVASVPGSRLKQGKAK